MKRWEQLPRKALAFCLAVLCFAGAAVMGCYQYANGEAIWSDGGNWADSYAVRSLERRDEAQLQLLAHLWVVRQQGTAQGTSTDGYYQQRVGQIQRQLSAEATNLRWQILWGEKQVLSNSAEDYTQRSLGLYWSAGDEVSLKLEGEHAEIVPCAWTQMGAADHGVVQAGAYNCVAVTDPAGTLQALVDEYRSTGTASLPEGVDMDTVWLDLEGRCTALSVWVDGQAYLFGPSLNTALGLEELCPYLYQPEEDSWTVRERWERMSVVMWLDEEMAVADSYQATRHTLELWRSFRGLFLACNILLVLAGVGCTIYLCAAAGRRRGVEGIHLNPFHRIPGEVVVLLLLTLAALSWVGAVGGLSALENKGVWPDFSLQLILVGLTVGGGAAAVVGGLVTVAVRCKAGTLWSNTIAARLLRLCQRLCRWCLQLAGRCLRSVGLVWKVGVLGGGYVLCTLFAVLVRLPRQLALLLWLGSVLILGYVLVWACQWKRIRQGTREIIGGRPDYHMDTARMLPDLKEHAEALNNLGQSISDAVDERLRSEHFRAELITNVSHDLKTPLTSIINYVDLLKKEEIDNPRAAEYIAVLDRKSQRLKKLTEDLVEASKASTGSLTVVRERLDLGQLLDQALGEYGQRLERAGLSVVRSTPEHPVWVMADGRHLWRVLDNLLSNCAKYALGGTRVYVDLQVHSDCAVLTVKNISRQPLNMEAGRLMERFVRGDASRTEEGSGLGLSIAQSLTELQQGRFQLEIDGDLFKASVTLPITGGEQEALPPVELD